MPTLTELIFQSKSPWDNPYQGTDKKVLFVCSAGILRSATAARIYAKKYNTRACGSMSYALIPLSDDLFLWADKVVFVNRQNFDWVKNDFPWDEKEYVVLNIPDSYPHTHPELIAAFENQFEHVN